MNFLTKIKSYLHQNDNVTLPWEFQENSENTRNAKTEILEIYKQEQIFFDQYDDFPFVFENIINIANEVVQKDPNLGLLHKKFVSKKQEQIIKGFLIMRRMDDHQFWKSYFRQVEIIKAKFKLPSFFQSSDEDIQI